jgi:kumamolisin
MCSIHIPTELTDLTSIETVLTKYSLTYTVIAENLNSISVTGTITNDFLSEMKQFESQGVFIAYETNVTFKTYIKKPVAIQYTRLGQRIMNTRYNKAYTMNNIKSIYNLPSTSLSSRTKIGIIELGGGYRSSDLTVMWNYLGLGNTKPVVNSISVDGARNSPGSDADFEVDLDIQVIGGMCPYSTINVYFGQNTTQGFYNAIARAMSDGNKIISISWGASEANFGSSSLNAYNSLFATAVSQGITICVAAGDNGARDNGSSLSVDFPGSAPNVLDCGGTTLVSNNNLYDSNTTEIAWTGSGGGFSYYFARPTYQNGFQTNSKRAVPDVCGDADPNTGYIIYLNGGYYVIGGTSAVAPLWAGFLGSINFTARNGSLASQLYSKRNANPTMFHDVKSGNNGYYSAGTGYDEVTGLGSPNFTVIKSLIN